MNRTAAAPALGPPPRAAVWVLASLFTLGVAIRIVGIVHASPTAVVNMPLADDAFYYFSLARNASECQFPVISGDGRPTAGFQPLWGSLLAGLDVVLGGPPPATRIAWAISLGGVISMIAGLVVLDLGLRLSRSWTAATIAFGGFVLSPQVLKHSLNGMETSLALLAGVGLFRLFVGFDPVSGSRRSALVLGLAGGAAVLARIDLALLLAAGVIVAVAAGPKLALRRGLGRAVLVGVGALLPVAIWAGLAVGWGTKPLPDAGSAIRNLTLLLQDLPLRSPLDSIREAPGVFLPVYGGYVLEFTSAWLRQVPLLLAVSLPMFAALPLGTAVGLSAALAWFASLAAMVFVLRRGEPGLKQLTIIWLLFAASMTVAYSLVILGPWFFQRYSALLGVLGQLLLVCALARWLDRHRWRGAVYAAAALVMFLAFGALVVEGSYRWILEGPRAVPADGWYRAAVYVDENLPPQARLGAFSAGILTYYARQPVLALDGKVSSEARRAMVDGEMLDYVCRSRIEFIVDWEKMVDRLLIRRSDNWQPGHLVLRRTIDGGTSNDILIYEVAPEACPSRPSD